MKSACTAAAILGVGGWGDDGWMASAWAAEKKKKPALASLQKVVAIDAGHGGQDPGCIGFRGTHEKQITIAVARNLARRLEATGHYKVVMTRTQDVFVPLGSRVALARRAGAQLFLSLHADSAPQTGVRGFSVYTLAEHASDTMAASLAQRENAADLVGGVSFSQNNREVARVLLDLMRRGTANGSLTLAHTVVSNLSGRFQSLARPRREANFVVLRAPDVPSALVEMGFLSNAQDERLLNQVSYQANLSDRLMRAIDGFFQA